VTAKIEKIGIFVKIVNHLLKQTKSGIIIL